MAKWSYESQLSGTDSGHVACSHHSGCRHTGDRCILAVARVFLFATAWVC